MEQHPPEGPEPELVATPEEAISAWHALSTDDKVKLEIFAAAHARWRQAYEPGIEGLELINEAARRIFDGTRKWKRRQISFLECMFGTIKSIAGDLKRTNEGQVRAVSRTEAELLVGVDSDDPINPIENISGDLDTPEELAIAQDRLRAIQCEFENDETAWLVLQCLFVDNLSPGETRAHLGLSEQDFNAARRRIYNRIPKFFLPN